METGVRSRPQRARLRPGRTGPGRRRLLRPRRALPDLGRTNARQRHDHRNRPTAADRSHRTRWSDVTRSAMSASARPIAASRTTGHTSAGSGGRWVWQGLQVARRRGRGRAGAHARPLRRGAAACRWPTTPRRPSSNPRSSVRRAYLWRLTYTTGRDAQPEMGAPMPSTAQSGPPQSGRPSQPCAFVTWQPLDMEVPNERT